MAFIAEEETAAKSSEEKRRNKRCPKKPRGKARNPTACLRSLAAPRLINEK